MNRIRFECDYSEGALPELMERLCRTNLEQTAGYGEDEYCRSAARRIKALCQMEDAEVHFLVGGTQANLTVIASILRPHQGVIAAATGHINVHETGAIESCGHKVLAVPSVEGKLSADSIERLCREHWADESHEHTVQPGMVYISFPTEYGTLYGEKELEEISAVCRKNHLPLFIDGARMGYGLMSEKNDVSLKRLAQLCDVFYIGGTKCGALFGEAVVIVNPELQCDFRYIMKQKGGMLAKGRLLGVQFDTLFAPEEACESVAAAANCEDSNMSAISGQQNSCDGGEAGTIACGAAAAPECLYFQAAARADRLALKLRSAFEAKGYRMFVDSWTNQQFPVLPNEELERLREQFDFSVWEKADEKHTVVRFCTSWATTEEQVDCLIARL